MTHERFEVGEIAIICAPDDDSVAATRYHNTECTIASCRRDFVVDDEYVMLGHRVIAHDGAELIVGLVSLRKLRPPEALPEGVTTWQAIHDTVRWAPNRAAL
jgi:hypothetical protein